jgi:phospholipid transport system substrate-binding protein
MMRRYLPICTLVLVIATFTAAPERGMAQGAPVVFVNDLGTQAIQVLGKNVAPAERLQRFRQLFASDFDIPGIGQFVLGRYWRAATPQEQQDFLKLLNEYLAQAYSARLAEYAGEPFRAIGAKPDGDETVVASEITRTDGNKIRIDWHLVDRGGWKITDAYVAGVSMKVTQRDEFASVIQQGGGQVSYLIGRLRQKVGG